MKTVSLSGSLRENVGKKDAKKNRKEGKIPCVIYGGKEQVHFSLDEKPFSKIIFTPEVYLIKITIDNKEYDAILQDIQYHPVTDKILHADFLEVLLDKPITMGIPVKITGVAPGILAGGRLRKKIRKLRVKGLVEFFPDDFELDISHLEINTSIKVRDLEYENLELIDTPGAVIVQVSTARGAGMGEEEVEEEEEEEVEEGAEEGGEEGAPAAKAGDEKPESEESK